ncbi:MAG: FtsQ-type POTRA domain-containing protein [Oscillospiraceae bacterium]|nr:FtsQ-type POTRA domain-containing protein [Oscillospiraceae bacterium]
MPEFNPPKRRSKPKKKKPAKSVKPANRSAPSPKPAPQTPPKSAPTSAPRPAPPAKPAQSAKKPATSAKRRRSNRVLYYVMFLLVFVIAFSILSTTVLFKITEVVAVTENSEETAGFYTAEQIVEATGINTGANLLRLNSEIHSRNVLDNLIYIDSVQIKKSLPGKVTVYVVEAVEMANIAELGQTFIISEKGRILGAVYGSAANSNTIIYGYEPDEPVLGEYIRSVDERKTDLVFAIMQRSEMAGLRGIVSINLHDPLDITMNYMNRVELQLGSGVELELKLRVAAEMLENQIDVTEHGTIRLQDPLRAVFKDDVEDEIAPWLVPDDDDDDDDEPGEPEE